MDGNRFERAMDEINRMIEESKGEQILLPSGRARSFVRYKTYSEDEIRSFEAANHISLPVDYRLFLKKVGAGHLYVDGSNLGLEFLKLEDLESFSKEVFLTWDNPYPELLIIVSIDLLGDVGGFDMSRDEPESFSVFLHEAPPDIWIEEVTQWMTFGDWFSMIVESEGQEDLPG